MPTKVLLLGRKPFDREQVEQDLTASNVRLVLGTTLADVRAAFVDQEIDVVIMGAGIDLPTRLEIVGHVFKQSTGTSVHMKDHDSGPGGMMPFVNGILSGLA